MKINEAILIAIACACAAVVILFIAPNPLSKNALTEAEQVDAANRVYYGQIFQRCDGVPELKQFVSVFKPTEALEFFDNETMSKVVSVACVTEFSDRFTATFVAPVVINEAGTYTLTGDIDFRIEDKKGTFRKIFSNGSSEGSSISLNHQEWSAFMESGNDVESLRELHSYRDM